MKKLLTLALALVALATGAMAQEKKIGKKSSTVQGYRYANEKYSPRKFKKVALYTTCKTQSEIDAVISTFEKAGLKLELQKEDKFNPPTAEERIKLLTNAGFDGYLNLKVATDETYAVNFVIDFQDIIQNVKAVSYELKLYLGVFSKGTADKDKTYNRVCENILDDFRQYF